MPRKGKGRILMGLPSTIEHFTQLRSCQEKSGTRKMNLTSATPTIMWTKRREKPKRKLVSLVRLEFVISVG